MNTLSKRFESDPSMQDCYHAFEFDKEKMLFLVDGQEIPVSDFANDTYEETETVETDFEKTPLVICLSHNLIGTKALDDWIKSKRYNPNTVQREVMVVMWDVFDQQFTHETGEPYFDEEYIRGSFNINDRPIFYNFGFSFREAVFAGLNFQVAGNCACLSNDFSGSAASFNPEEDGCVSYDIHNIDTSFKRVAIYAGIGHVARLASGRPFAQMTIDGIGVND